jgi:hypothetical protein
MAGLMLGIRRKCGCFKNMSGFAVVKGGDAGALSSLKVRGLVLLVREVEHSSSPLSQEVIAAVDRVCWS